MANAALDRIVNNAYRVVLEVLSHLQMELEQNWQK
jgi:hypothetical protein